MPAQGVMVIFKTHGTLAFTMPEIRFQSHVLEKQSLRKVTSGVDPKCSPSLRRGGRVMEMESYSPDKSQGSWEMLLRSSELGECYRITSTYPENARLFNKQSRCCL
ncbi:uncharacterized protein LOC110333626 [Mus pahari]|uniref:uncharacterized protein LOC110333626 n=1 Tax=Mus pahari TaxID=10093 RepID=UPI000A30602D|nr:uncharacterized protein LOC110333626 [Mus pahari]